MFVASNQSSSTPSTADQSGVQTNRSDMVHNPYDDPDHDWESHPIVPDGTPVTPQEFTEDAQAGQAPGEVPTEGPIAVTSERIESGIGPGAVRIGENQRVSRSRHAWLTRHTRR
ncbi:hypothetical protein [Nocardia sp. CC227C]|uniref:hypothetical protein n=1 Tax=Nocardia sp. CC227C TaxID=3044562 RepID=UPI00278C5E07|nr:hypothetical protein [Nocardia sp. CC227C]